MGDLNKVAISQVGLLLISERKFRRPPTIEYYLTIEAVSEEESGGMPGEVAKRYPTPYLWGR